MFDSKFGSKVCGMAAPVAKRQRCDAAACSDDESDLDSQPHCDMPLNILRRHCRKHNLTVRGTKDEVWQRLKSHLEIVDLLKMAGQEEGEEERDSDFEDDGLADSDEPDARAQPDYDMPLNILRTHCKKHKLTVRGTKDQVWQRLQNHLETVDEPMMTGEEEAREEEEEEEECDDCTVGAGRDVSGHKVQFEQCQGQDIISGKRTIYAPERFSPSGSVDDDDDDFSDNISLDSSIQDLSSG